MKRRKNRLKDIYNAIERTSDFKPGTDWAWTYLKNLAQQFDLTKKVPRPYHSQMPVLEPEFKAAYNALAKAGYFTPKTRRTIYARLFKSPPASGTAKPGYCRYRFDRLGGASLELPVNLSAWGHEELDHRLVNANTRYPIAIQCIVNSVIRDDSTGNPVNPTRPWPRS